MAAARLHVGGNWNNSSFCGPRSVNLNNVSANVNANNGARGVSDTRCMVFSLTPRLSLRASPTRRNTKRRVPQYSNLLNPCGAVMKRLGNVWDVVISIENLRAAFKKAAKGRNYLHHVRRIKRNPDKYLYRIQSMLRDGTYEVRGYRSKTIYEPKKRTIHALPFYPHRIIHHAVMNVLAPYWESIFIYDSYACRTGKGQHAGSRRCAQFVRRNKYVLKCDVSKFYHSIPHIGLKAVLRKKLKDKKLLQLLDIMIDSSALCEGLSSDRGVNIGSLPSQWFGNLYMHELDTYVKHVLGVKDYLRYCDDFVLFSNDKEQLKVWKVAVQNFVNDRLGLTLSKCNLFPSTHGVDFLGYRHFKGYVLLRKSTSKRIARRMKSIRK